LFREFVAAALAYNAAERLPVEIPDDDPRPIVAAMTDDAEREQQIRAVS